jgi:hypothetical protein
MVTLGVTAAAGHAAITGVPGGDAAPPPTLGPYTMTLFGPDLQPDFSSINSVPSPLGGSVGIAPNMIHLTVPTTWTTWSHGYTGAVYWSEESLSVTLTLPANTGAFFFYAQPNEAQVFDIVAQSQDGTAILQSPDGNAGATYYGYFATGGDTIQSITVSSDRDFAIGEFGIADLSSIPEASTWGAASAVAGLAGFSFLRRRFCR